MQDGISTQSLENRYLVFALGDFNARLHRRFAGESTHLGERIFGKPAAQHNPTSNRTLLLELCGTHGLAIANTFFNHPPKQ